MVAAGVVLRIAYVLLVLDGVDPGLDADWYVLQGGSIRAGTGYVVPTSLFQAEQVPTAGFPPVYPAYQAIWQTIAGDGPTSVRLAGVVPAAVTIALAGLAGRAVAGRRVGLLAAAIVAVDPTLIAVDGSSMSENVTMPLVLAVVWVAAGLRADGPRPWRVALLGVLCGVAALARQDLLLLTLVGVGAVGIGHGHVGRTRRLAAAAAVVALAATVVVPWAWRNERAVGAFTVSTLSPSSVLAGANCDTTYGGADLGSWSYPCVAAAIPPGEPTEVEVADAQQAAARAYVGDHLHQVPLVVAARQARVWAFWDPRDLARRDAEESRRYGWQVVSRPLDAVLAVTGTIGLVVLIRRRGHPGALLLLAPIVVVAASTTISHGNPRFNAIAHPVLAIGLAALVIGWSSSRRPGDGGGRGRAGEVR